MPRFRRKAVDVILEMVASPISVQARTGFQDARPGDFVAFDPATGERYVVRAADVNSTHEPLDAEAQAYLESAGLVPPGSP